MTSKGSPRTVRQLAIAAAILPQFCLIPPLQAQAPSAEQSPSRPGIRVAPVILAEPEVETAISISVGPDGTYPRQTFLRVRGLPQAARLTEGHPVSAGVWAVPLSALPTLRVHAPLSSSGRTEIQLSLISIDGGVLAETKSSLVVAPAWLLGTSDQRQDLTRAVPQTRPEPPAPIAAPAPAPQPIAPVVATAPAAPAIQPEPKTIPAVASPANLSAVPPSAPAVTAPAAAAAPAVPAPQAPPQAEPQPAVVAALPPPAPAAKAAVAPPPPPPPVATPTPAAPPVLSAADRERAESMVQRGDTFWKQGSFAAARQFFRRAADMGLAAGALRMGATFDPVELTSINVVGLQPDPKEAAQWYVRARELGAPEASARLSRVQAR